MDTLIARVEEWKAEGKNREVLTVTQPADGIYLLLRQLREGSPLAKETLGLLQWNGGGANSSGRASPTLTRREPCIRTSSGNPLLWVT